MNQKQLEKKVKYWQTILHLDHWDITCEFGHPTKMNGRFGTSGIQGAYLTSHITIQNPKNYESDNLDKDKEIERIIIHELLHCHLNILKPDDSDEKAGDEDRVITLLEKSIYKLWAGE